MSLKYYFKLILLCSFALSSAFASAQGKKRIMVRVGAKGAPDELNSVLSRNSLSVCDSIDALGVKIIEVDEGEASQVYENICQCSVDYAEFDAIATSDFIPNDAYVQNGTQWYLNAINAYEGWDITQGSSDIVIAVLDSGVNAQHPDLAGKVLTNRGYDFVNNDTDPSDDFGHGTSVAGTAAAATNNGIGIAGIGFNSKILPVKVMSATNSALYSNIAKGIIYAADQGARIINLSLSGTSPSVVLQNAVNYAWGKDCIIICSTGNSGTYDQYYPSACDNVLAVSASDVRGDAPSWSTKGTHVDVVAPGQGIQSTSMNGGYVMTGGTSFSAPIVAGLASLVASSPQALSNQQIVNIIQQTATDIGTVGKDAESGFGIVNVERALLAAFPIEEMDYEIVEDPLPSYIRIIEVESNQTSVALYADEGVTVTIQSSSDLQTWQDLQEVVGTGSEQTIVCANESDDCAFIRLNSDL